MNLGNFHFETAPPGPPPGTAGGGPGAAAEDLYRLGHRMVRELEEFLSRELARGGVCFAPAMPSPMPG